MPVDLEKYRLGESALIIAEELRSGIDLTSVAIDNKEHKEQISQLDAICGEGFIPVMPAEISRVMSMGDWRNEPELFQAMQTMSNFIQENSIEALKEYSTLENKIKSLKKLVHQISTSEDPAQATFMKHAANFELDTALAKIEEIPLSDRDAFFAIQTKKVAEFALDLQGGRIVEVPFVTEKQEAILSNLEQYKPVLIHGETGTGKTEVARIAAQKFSGKDAIVVRGYSGMDSTELFGHMSLKAINLSSAYLIPKKIEEEIAKYEKANPDIQNKKLSEAKNQIISAVLSKNSATYSEYILGAVYNALKNGQVVILDEANYIPPDLLAKLNDIMTKRPGEFVNIQEDGKSPVKVKQGYGLILTGNVNLDTKNKRYTNRFEIDTALLDRLGQGMIEYDFLPQAIEGKPSQYSLEEKQLYAVAIAALVSHKNLKVNEDSVSGFRNEESLNINGKEVALDPAMKMLKTLPNLGTVLLPDGALEQIWNLTKLARITQRIFTKTLGQNDDYALQSNGVPVTIQTNRAITNRGLISIIEDWRRDGFTKELDSYLFKYLISGKTDLRQSALFYMNAKAQGFFTTEGWDKNDDYIQNIDTFKFQDPKNKAMQLRIHNSHEIVEALFGEAPVRKNWPNEDENSTQAVKNQSIAAQSFEILSEFADNCSRLSEICLKFPFLRENLDETQNDLIELWNDKSACIQFFLSNQNISEAELKDEIKKRIKDGKLTSGSSVSELLIGAGLITQEELSH